MKRKAKSEATHSGMAVVNPKAAAPSLVWPAARQLSTEGRDCGVTGLSAPARAPAGHRGLSYPAYAEGHDGDESPASSRRFRHHRGDRHAHHPRDHRRSCLLYTSDAADEEDSVDLG